MNGTKHNRHRSYYRYGKRKRDYYISKAAFETLHQSDFRIAVDVIKTVLIRVGEIEE